MKKTSAFIITLPLDLLKQLNEHSSRLKVPKSHLVEEALRSHFEHLKRMGFVHSFQRAAQDPEMLELSKGGFEDYLEHLD